MDRDTQPDSEKLQEGLLHNMRAVLGYENISDNPERWNGVMSEKALCKVFTEVLSHFPEDAQELIALQKKARNHRNGYNGVLFQDIAGKPLEYMGRRDQVYIAIDSLLFVKGMREDQEPNRCVYGLRLALNGKNQDTINLGQDYNDAEMIKKAFEIIGITDEDEQKIQHIVNTVKHEWNF